MKIFNKFIILAGLAALSVACNPDAEKFVPGEEIPGAFFSTALPASYTIGMTDTSVAITVSRTDASSAASASINFTGDAVFSAPASVEFAAGQSEATINLGVAIDELEIDRSYPVTLALTSNATPYGKSEYSFSVICPATYESIGTGYWVDNTMADWYGVDPDIALAVEIERAETPAGTKFRFSSPFARVATAVDALGGFNGYPYNDEADLVPGTYTIVVTVTPDGVVMDPADLGMDWGDGMFTMGTAYGNLDDDIEACPLGVYDEAAGWIVFGPNSLFLGEANYGYGVIESPSYLFLSAEAFAAWLEE